MWASSSTDTPGSVWGSRVWGLTTHPGKPWVSWDGRGLFGRLPTFSVVSSLHPSACLNIRLSSCGFTRHPAAPFSLAGCFRERHTQHASKPEALQPTRETPGGFWDKRGLLGRLLTSSVVSPCLLSACPNVPLSPFSPPTPPCSPVSACWGFLREIHSLDSKSWGFKTHPEHPYRILGWESPF